MIDSTIFSVEEKSFKRKGVVEKYRAVVKGNNIFYILSSAYTRFGDFKFTLGIALVLSLLAFPWLDGLTEGILLLIAIVCFRKAMKEFYFIKGRFFQVSEADYEVFREFLLNSKSDFVRAYYTDYLKYTGRPPVLLDWQTLIHFNEQRFHANSEVSNSHAVLFASTFKENVYFNSTQAKLEVILSAAISFMIIGGTLFLAKDLYSISEFILWAAALVPAVTTIGYVWFKHLVYQNYAVRRDPQALKETLNILQLESGKEALFKLIQKHGFLRIKDLKDLAENHPK